MAFYEVEGFKTLDQTDKDQWFGTRAWLCDASEVSTLSRMLWDNPFPSMTGDFTPRVYNTKAKYHPADVPGAALVVAYYRTKLIPGKAIIRTRGSYRPRRAIVDLDDKIIEGPESAWIGTKMPEWTVVKGNNIYLETNCEFEVRTAIARSDYSDEAINSIRGTVNNSRFNIRGYCDVGTLLFKSFESIDRYQQDPIEITYLFGYEVNGWNNSVESQLGHWALEQKLVYDSTGTSTGTNRTVKVFHPGYDTNGSQTSPEKRRLFYAENWNAIKDSSTW